MSTEKYQAAQGRRAVTERFQMIALLTDLNKKFDQLIRLTESSNGASFTIPEFCSRNSISPSHYHKLRRTGRGPRIMITGDKSVRISRQAEADWIVEREAET